MGLTSCVQCDLQDLLKETPPSDLGPEHLKAVKEAMVAGLGDPEQAPTAEEKLKMETWLEKQADVWYAGEETNPIGFTIVLEQTIDTGPFPCFDSTRSNPQ